MIAVFWTITRSRLGGDPTFTDTERQQAGGRRVSEPTVGDVAKFLRENPGPHRIGEYTVEHRGSFDRQDWKAGNEEIEP